MAQSPKSKGQTQNHTPDESAPTAGSSGGGTPSFDQIIEMLKEGSDGRARSPAPQLRRAEVDSTPPSSIPPLAADEGVDPFSSTSSSQFEEDPLEMSGGELNFGEGDFFGEEGFNFNFDDAEIDMSLDPFAEPTGELTPAPSAPRIPQIELPKAVIEVEAGLSEREISAPPLSRNVEEGESRVPSPYLDRQNEEDNWTQSAWDEGGPDRSATHPMSAVPTHEAEEDHQSDEDYDESSEMWSRPPLMSSQGEATELASGEAQQPDDPQDEATELASRGAQQPDELLNAQINRAPEFSTYPPAAPPPQDELSAAEQQADPWQEAGGIMLDDDTPSSDEDVSSDPIVFPSEPDPTYSSSVVGFISPGDSAPPEEHAAASGIPGASVIHVPTDAPDLYAARGRGALPRGARAHLG